MALKLNSNLSSSILKREQIEIELNPSSSLRCGYRTGKCNAIRAIKRNGKPHNLCEFHRSKANWNQKKLDEKKRLVRGSTTLSSKKNIRKRNRSRLRSISSSSNESIESKTKDSSISVETISPRQKKCKSSSCMKNRPSSTCFSQDLLSFSSSSSSSSSSSLPTTPTSTPTLTNNQPISTSTCTNVTSTSTYMTLLEDMKLENNIEPLSFSCVSSTNEASSTNSCSTSLKKSSGCTSSSFYTSTMDCLTNPKCYERRNGLPCCTPTDFQEKPLELQHDEMDILSTIFEVNRRPNLSTGIQETSSHDISTRSSFTSSSNTYGCIPMKRVEPLDSGSWTPIQSIYQTSTSYPNLCIPTMYSREILS